MNSLPRIHVLGVRLPLNWAAVDEVEIDGARNQKSRLGGGIFEASVGRNIVAPTLGAAQSWPVEP